MSTEFRESLILTLGQADGQPWASLAEAPSMGEFMYGPHADALIAGPLAGLLAENERLRISAHNWEFTARDGAKVLDRVNGSWGDALAERDRLRAQVEAVREVVSNTDLISRAMKKHLRAILNAADGGGSNG